MSTDETLTLRYWDTQSPHFQFPEQADAELGYGPVQERPSTGLALSGGGTASVSLIAGYLRALTEQGLMTQLAYISGVSGGAWGSVPYCYQPTDIAESDFLGPSYAPGELRRWKLRWRRKRSLIRTVTKAQIANRTLRHGIHTHEAFSRAVGDIFLRPFGLTAPATRHERSQYFTTTPAAARAFRERNSHLTEEDFLCLHPHRPFPIINGVMFVPKAEKDTTADDFHTAPFEITPLYTGIPGRQPYAGKDGQTIGGSYIETPGLESTPIAPAAGGTIRVIVPRRTELCEPLGISGSAFAKMMVEYKSGLKLLFPQYPYWTPKATAVPTPQTYEFGDGWLIDNLGILPLLVRQVRQVVVLSTVPFEPEAAIHVNDPSEKTARYFGYNQVAALFGQPIYDINPLNKSYGTLIDDPQQRQVFASQDFGRLQAALKASRKAGGVVHCQGQFEIQDNPALGVKGGWTCEILWMFVDKTPKWEIELPKRIRKSIGRIGPLWNFPVLRIFFQNPPHIIQLSAMQANLLNHLGHWMMGEMADKIATLWGKNSREG